ncbi:MAG: flippase-like domain-containing protein [Candidatus Cloacimonetes bacterium]|nr:flippase-like domain-containing protein [Candidatus Cloacimonadota bacterium]
MKLFPRPLDFISHRRKLLQILLLIALLSYITIYIFKHTDEFRVVRGVAFLDLLLLLLAQFSYLFFSAWQLLIIKRKFGLSGIDFPNWFRVFLIARFLNQFLPQGGNLYRALKLKKEYGFPYEKYLLSFSFFVWFNLFLSLILLLVAMTIVNSDYRIAEYKIYFLLIIIIFALLLFPVLGFVLDTKKKHRRKFLSRLVDLYHQFGYSIKDRKFLAKMLLLGIVNFLIYLTVMYLCFRSLDLSPDLVILTVFSILLKLSFLVILLPGNLGLTEVMSGILSSMSGYEFGIGIIISALSRISVYLLLAVLGLLLGGIPLIKKMARAKSGHTSEL